MRTTTATKLKDVEKALRRMPTIWKREEAEYREEMRFARKIFGSTVKEILKYRLSK